MTLILDLRVTIRALTVPKNCEFFCTGPRTLVKADLRTGPESLPGPFY